MANLNEILKMAGSLAMAEQMARELVAKDEQFLLDLELILSARGKFEEARKLIDELAGRHPDDDRIAFNRGWHTLRAGDLAGGIALLDRGRKVGVFGSLAMEGSKPLWDGGEVKGKTILLHGEGGLGDEMVNVRFAKAIADRGGRVLVSCHPTLKTIFSRVPGVWQVVANKDLKSDMYDAWLPAMSAAGILGYSYDTLPPATYLTARPDMVAKWAKIITADPGVLKIGLRWSGNPQFEHEQFRRFPVEPLLALAQIPGVKLFSLQRDVNLWPLPPVMADLGWRLETWEDTAGAIANLDLVVSSCTSVAHLAGAMGRETWVIVPLLPYYIWARPGDTSSWYETVRLFRQTTEGDWRTPLAAVKNALLTKLGRNTMTAIMGSSNQPKLESAKTLHFVAGLPRAGSTMLVSLLAQNPTIFGAPVSGLCGIINGVSANWDKIEFHREVPNESAKISTLRAILEHYYDAIERSIIIDKERNWIRLIALLEKVLARPVKMIVPVRPIVEILASFEALRQKDPLNVAAVDEQLGPRSTLASRCQYFMDDGGAVGSCYNYLKDAVISGWRDRLLFVDYNKFVLDPVADLNRLYDFLELPSFKHDFSRIPQLTRGDDAVWRYPGLHTVRPALERQSVDPLVILGPELTALYSRVEPWEQWT